MVNNRYTPQESLDRIKLMMKYDLSKTLNENVQVVGLLPNILESVVITDWVSPDDRYLILFDELYDLHSKEKLGDIWENIENFKLFMSHSFEVAANVPQQIKEEVSSMIKSLILTESINDVSKIKPILKQIIREQETFTDWVGKGIKKTGQWFKDQATDFGYDLKSLVTTGFEGAKKVLNGLNLGDWKQVLDLLSKGMLFFARKVRSLLYNPIGIILDAILVATGIGKAAQWIPWAIVVALDLYEIISGDYEQKELAPWLRWLMIGCDVLGLVSTAGVASSAKAAFDVFKGVKTEEEFAQVALKNPNTVKWIEKITAAFSKVPEYLGKAATYLKSTKLAKASPWIEKLLGKAESVLTKGAESLTKITKTANTARQGGEALKLTQAGTQTAKEMLRKGLKSGLRTAGTVKGVDTLVKKGIQKYKGISDEEWEQQETMARTMKNFERENGMSLNDYINSKISN